MASAQENENKQSRVAEVNNKSDVKNGWAERSIEKNTSERGKGSQSVRERARTEAL